jgi:xanthine dehydrogenase accessory factor
MKIGDLDPRDDPRFCWLVSDKSLAVGGGVLEAILASQNLHGAWLES